MLDPVLSEQLGHTLADTRLDELGERYRGKVRDVYRQRDRDRLFLVATDRLSAFDRVLTTIPFKGEVLNRIARFWFEKTEHVIPNHVLDTPDPNVTVARATTPYPVEVVVRGYLTGSLWRDVEKGAHTAYGLDIPPGMRKDAAFPEPILTPSTKAPVGEHDEPLSEAEVVRRGIVPAREWARIREAALGLFRVGQEWCRTRGLLLVDTKYEFGAVGNTLYLIDEMHTPDSSRFWRAGEYEARFAAGERPGHARQGERPAVVDSREGLQRSRPAPGHPGECARGDGRALSPGLRGDHRNAAHAGPGRRRGPHPEELTDARLPVVDEGSPRDLGHSSRRSGETDPPFWTPFVRSASSPIATARNSGL